MASAASMRRGAREANEESARLAQLESSRDLGAALGKLVVFIREIQELGRRVEALEREVRELRAAQQATGGVRASPTDQQENERG